MRRFTTLTLVLASLTWVPAKAAESLLVIPVPESEVNSSGMISRSGILSSSDSSLELSFSNWAPTQLQTQSWGTQASAFQREPWVPMTGVNYLFNMGQWDWKAGVGYLPMFRQGIVNVKSVSQAVVQDLFLVPAQIGVEYHPNALKWHSISPYVSGALMPTLVMANESPLSNGTASVAFPVEFAFGVSSRISALPGSPSLDLSAVMSASPAAQWLSQGMDFFGVGVLAGMRFDI